jgi:hypothetical protein
VPSRPSTGIFFTWPFTGVFWVTCNWQSDCPSWPSDPPSRCLCVSCLSLIHKLADKPIVCITVILLDKGMDPCFKSCQGYFSWSRSFWNQNDRFRVWKLLKGMKSSWSVIWKICLLFL